MKGKTHMATERTDGDLHSGTPVETAVAAGDAGAALHVPNNRVWYRYLSEDWLATIAGLLLVILLVVGWLHSIP
jgi:hypothetical protein